MRTRLMTFAAALVLILAMAGCGTHQSVTDDATMSGGTAAGTTGASTTGGETPAPTDPPSDPPGTSS